MLWYLAPSRLISFVETFFVHFSDADVRQWEYIAYCLSQLTFTERGFKKLIEYLKTYEHALCEDSVIDHFRNIISKVINIFIFSV